MTIKRERKKIIYVDMDHVEFGTRLTKLEKRTRELLQTTRNLGARIFWLDIEEGLKRLTRMQRACFMAKYIDGNSEREVAKRLYICRAVAHRHIKNSRKKLKIFLGGGAQNAPK